MRGICTAVFLAALSFSVSACATQTSNPAVGDSIDACQPIYTAISVPAANASGRSRVMRVRSGDTCGDEVREDRPAWHVPDASFEQSQLSRRIEAAHDDLLRVDWSQVDREFLEEQLGRSLLVGRPGVPLGDLPNETRSAALLSYYRRLMRFTLAAHPQGHVSLQGADLTWHPVSSAGLIREPERFEEALAEAAWIRTELLRRLSAAYGSADQACEAVQLVAGSSEFGADYSADHPMIIYHDHGFYLGERTLAVLDHLVGGNNYRLHRDESLRGVSDLSLISVLDDTVADPLAQTPALAEWRVDLQPRQGGESFQVVRDRCIRRISPETGEYLDELSLENCTFPIFTDSGRPRSARFGRNGFPRLARDINARVLSDWRMENGLIERASWREEWPNSTGVPLEDVATRFRGREDLADLYQQTLARGSWPGFIRAYAASDSSIHSAACVASGHLRPRLQDQRAAMCIRATIAPEQLPCAWSLAFIDW